MPPAVDTFVRVAPILGALGIVLAGLADVPALAAPAPTAATAFTGFAATDLPGIHNAFRAGTNVVSGSAPEGDAAFAALARLGIRTILSVDGARPDVDGARRHGLRTVHLPLGYDGINPSEQAALIQAARTLPGPIYVHCHRGKHRGPAAAAVMCLGTEGWSRSTASLFLDAAGTATNYAGLHAAVREFHPPTVAALAAAPRSFPSVAPVPPLVETMVAIDRQWERLGALRRNQWRVPPADPDLVPAGEARGLRERFRELARLALERMTDRKSTHDFIAALRDAEAQAARLEDALVASPDIARLEAAFQTLAQSCLTCHRTHRD